MTNPQLPRRQVSGFAQPGPPEKKPNRRIVLLATAVIVALFGLIAALGGTGYKSTEKSPDTNASAVAVGVNRQAPAAPAGPELNTPVRDGKFEFVVTDIQSGVKTVGDNEYLQETAQGSYLIVSVSVTNTSNSPKGFSPSDQYVFDTDDRKFGNDTMATIVLQPDSSVFEEINPGNTVTAQLVFDMPEGATADRIELHDSMFSGGADVALR
ncbi:DUF4352 domain-containing protein [Nocardia sp. NPDC005978]|uniref:DUF4352 domain-containing protein n=1 Tax=Nocardia sp. NPDC005978 TaxID=3156725 RepID=UPI0033AB907A